MEIINTNAVYIPSLDGKDIYISNSLDPKNGYRLKNKTGNLNLSRFINSLDYSLDLIKMRQVHKSLFPVADIEQLETVFSFDEKGNEYDEVHSRGKEYSCQVINVTFKYSNKEFNRVRGSYYIRFGYRIDDLEFEDCIAWDDGEIVGVQTGEKVNNPVDAEELPYFIFKDGMYRAKDNIKTCNNVADIRFDIYENGFVCEGIKYVRFKRSSGSSRVGKCLFINERLYNAMHEWEMCGIQVDEGQDIDLAALEPYIALTLSSIIDTIEIKPENILVVDDYKSVFHERAIATRLVDGRLVSQPEDVEISNSIWDGQSLMDRSLFGEYSNKGMLLLRARFFKSCCFNANIQQWFADHGIKKVSQLNGYTRAKKIEDVKLITTPSSIKYLKFGTLDQWLDTLETTFGVVKYEKKTHFFEGRMVQTHYQLINTLQMTYEEVEQFIKPSLDYARMIKTDPAVFRHQISYQYCTPDENYYTKAITSRNDLIYRILGMNERFAKTKMYGNFCNDLIKSFIKNLRCGHVLVHGNYSTLCGNPIEMLKMAIGQFDGKSVIETGTVHCEMFDNGKELLGSRSPHVTIGNILVTKNIIRPEIARYMNPTNEIVYVNSIQENLLERLSGADFDSDTMLLTDNEILVTAAKRNYDNFPVPTKLVESVKRNRRYTNREKADLDIKTSVNKIGEIINLSQELNSILWDRINKGASIEDVMELYCDISQLDVMSNLEIDSAKRENPANNIRELQLLKKKYDVRDKKNRHIRPLFFKYIDGYKGYRDEYYVYVEDDDEFQKLFKTDKFKDAQEIKKHSENNIVVERGRMSYQMHKTSMDYLQKCINKFYTPKIDVQGDFINRPLTDIIIDPELIDQKRITKKQRNDTLNLICRLVDEARQKCNSVWGNSTLTSNEKREQIWHIRCAYANRLKEIQISEKQMAFFLKDVDGNYFGLTRFMFYLLIEEVRGFMLSTFYLVLQHSTAPISFLEECDEGDIQIYDFHYSKTNGEGEKFIMYYEDQVEFAEYVKSFCEKYGLKRNWLAKQVEINENTFNMFISNPLKTKLPKSDSYNLLSFINKYIAAMNWLEIL